ncbi:MAG: asparagine synthase (glutamine-hydrolyzing) [Magnetococcales bacterium]|nr:asparagine synthase (glutamine-hydrolyzing) [Magnetococcales bacterium]
MCGIVGQMGVGSDGQRQAALAALVHRGPDHGGHWEQADPPVWLGHRRLAIVDLSPSGNQPFGNETGTIHLVGNGEIYNAPALRRQLEERGHRFTSRSDNEVILHAYETWGEDCLERLVGMFAFILWDNPRGRLLAARDRVGIKPLCYAVGGEGITLASEITALLPLLSERPDPDPEALAHLLFYGAVPAPWSIWQGIRKLEPGHLLLWQRGEGLRIRRYWEPPRELDHGGSNPLAAWEALFQQVVADHLLSDVPMGLFLSGGLDSTAVAVALGQAGQTPEALTLGYPGQAGDETAMARETAAFLGLPHRAIALLPADIDAELERLIPALDEPQAFSALLSQYRICQAASRHYKVVLSGDGGDEAFSGYLRYRNLNQPTGGRSPALRRILRPLVRRFAPPLVRREAVRRFAWSSPLHRHAWRLFQRFLPEEIEALLAPLGVHYDDQRAFAPLTRHLEPRLPLGRALQRVDLMHFCSDHVLAKVDRTSMAHALEVRVPLLDHRVLEWALSRPPDPREETIGKPLLRDYLHRRVPERLLSRPKQGFSLRGGADADQRKALERIARGPWVTRGYWDRSWQRLVAPGVPNREQRIGVLDLVNRWGEHWLG